MIEKSIYDDYKIAFSDSYTSDDAYYFIFNNNRELHLTSDGTLSEELTYKNIDFKLYIGKFKGKDTFVVNTDGDDSFFDLKDIYDLDKDIYLMATRAVLVRDWYINHQYCGRVPRLY